MASICRTMRRNIVRNANKHYGFNLIDLGNAIALQRIINRDRQAKRVKKAK